MAGKGITKMAVSDGLKFVEDHYKFSPEEDVPTMSLAQCANSTFYTADGADLEDHLNAVPKRRDSFIRRHRRSKSASNSKWFTDVDDEPGSDPVAFNRLKQSSSIPNVSAAHYNGRTPSSSAAEPWSVCTHANVGFISPPASPNPELAGHADIGALGLAAYSEIHDACPEQVSVELSDNSKQEGMESKAETPRKSLAKLAKEAVVISVTAGAQQTKDKNQGKDVGQDTEGK